MFRVCIIEIKVSKEGNVYLNIFDLYLVYLNSPGLSAIYMNRGNHVKVEDVMVMIEGG